VYHDEESLAESLVECGKHLGRRGPRLLDGRDAASAQGPLEHDGASLGSSDDQRKLIQEGFHGFATQARSLTGRGLLRLEHVAKKWVPVLRTKTCVANNVEHAF